MVDLAVVAEEMGRLVAPGPLLPVNVVVDALARRGRPHSSTTVVPGLMAGRDDRGLGAGRSRAMSGGSTGSARRSWVEDGGDLLVSGRKRFVEAAASADVILVSAMSTGGTDPGARRRGRVPGLTVVPGRSVDLVRRFADVHLDGVRVPAQAVVGDVGDAAADIEHQCQLALALQVAETVGMPSTTCTATTVEYLEDRWSFGRPLASYQALKHRLADMLLALETAKGCAEAAADAVGTDER